VPIKRDAAIVPSMSEVPGLDGLTIVVADDNPLSLRMAEETLAGFGARVRTAATTRDLLWTLARERAQVVLMSIGLVDEQCIEFIRHYKAASPDTLLYLLTEEDYDLVETSLDAVKAVVDDYVRKPLDVARFARMAATSLGRPRTPGTALTVVEPLVTQVKPYFLFRSQAMQRALANLQEIAASGQTVLVSGETGAGKEIVARVIHVMSPRAAGPFVPINCGAIPESLIEGELFGHEKGAFTGAHRTRKGKFESANNGTLFLDEIGDMPLNLQVRLLRVLEERKVYRVGGDAPVPINVRVIAATRVDLVKAVRDGLFREDLYYRLNVLRVHLPPLSERPEDISLLALHFLERAFAEMGRPAPYPVLSPETIYLLEHLPWKGNVRELRNVMTRVATFIPPDTRRIFPFHILPHLEEHSETPSVRAVTSGGDGIVIPAGTPLDQVESIMIKEALRETGGNRSKAAKLLGISLRTLRRKLATSPQLGQIDR